MQQSPYLSSIPTSSPLIAAFMRGGCDVRAPPNSGVSIAVAVAIAPTLSIDVPEVTISRQRQLQQVSTKSDRTKVMQWMIDEVNSGSDENIASKAVRNFPELFRGSVKANLQKASRWWKAHKSFLMATNTTIEKK
jgi:hypothetical protein